MTGARPLKVWETVTKKSLMSSILFYTSRRGVTCRVIVNILKTSKKNSVLHHANADKRKWNRNINKWNRSTKMATMYTAMNDDRAPDVYAPFLCQFNAHSDLDWRIKEKRCQSKFNGLRWVCKVFEMVDAREWTI